MPRNADSPIISNWHTLYENFSTSSQDFYVAIEEAIRERKLPGIVISRVLFSEGGIGAPQREYLRVQRYRVAFDICSAPYGNGHFFSWWLTRIPPRFGVGATIGIFSVAMVLTLILQLLLSPMLPHGFVVGTLAWVALPFLLFPVVLLVMGHFVHEGSLGDEEWVMSLPIIGRLYVFAFNPLTYYRLDTAMMFRDSVRAAVNEAINQVREQKGLRLLGEEELRPDLEEEATA
jgi:hypothetical protein